MSSDLKWMLGGEAPGPQKWSDAKPSEKTDEEPSDTHTGTDPNGRAVGPKEDHTKPKPVLNDKGQKVTPKSNRSLRKK